MPRAGLTAERVVVEAGAVADEVGLDRLTLAAVAHRFGVSVPASTSTSRDSTDSTAIWQYTPYANCTRHCPG